jgi:dTDP-4-dehydrorhamnose 3,5-epimerase
MRIEALPLSGLVLAHSTAHVDSRGAFIRLFCEKSLSAVLNGKRIVQINQSRTAHVGAVRGMHYQKSPHAEMKLIRCLRGAVHDVAVDMRPESRSYLQHHAVELRADDGRLFVIPEGFAHGFQALEPDTELLYLHTAMYAPEAEDGVLHDDPLLAIKWQYPVTDISARDKLHKPLSARLNTINPI